MVILLKILLRVWKDKLKHFFFGMEKPSWTVVLGPQPCFCSCVTSWGDVDNTSNLMAHLAWSYGVYTLLTVSNGCVFKTFQRSTAGLDVKEHQDGICIFFFLIFLKMLI